MDLTTIFYNVDNFIKGYEQYSKYRLLPCHEYLQASRNEMSLSEIITVIIYYGTVSDKFKTLRAFYQYTYNELKSAFPGLVSYGRLIELRKKIILPMLMFFFALLIPGDGKSYIDSTVLEACHIKREFSHKVLKKLASKGKSTNGWFYGFKLHVIGNQRGELINVLLTAGNVADNTEWVIRELTRGLTGKLFGDKGYIINQELWHELYERCLQFIYGIRSNMKNKLMLMEDKMDLRRRANASESVFSRLKDRMSMQYTKNRSIYGFFCNLICMLIAYQLWARFRVRKNRKRPIIQTTHASKIALLIEF